MGTNYLEVAKWRSEIRMAEVSSMFGLEFIQESVRRRIYFENYEFIVHLINYATFTQKKFQDNTLVGPFPNAVANYTNIPYVKEVTCLCKSMPYSLYFHIRKKQLKFQPLQATVLNREVRPSTEALFIEINTRLLYSLTLPFPSLHPLNNFRVIY